MCRSVLVNDEKVLPLQYFPDDDPNKVPLLQWRATSQNLYSNWLNYYVYQLTPYRIEDISENLEPM